MPFRTSQDKHSAVSAGSSSRRGFSDQPQEFATSLRYNGKMAASATQGSFYWFWRRQLFFLQQRVFSALSFLLLDNQTGGRARAALLRINGASVGRRCFVRGGLQIQESFALTLGDDVFVNAACCFDLSAAIILESRVQLAYQVTLVTGGHEIGSHQSRAGTHCPAPIRVGEGAWIGARAIVLPGVTVGAGAVVAAGALVTKDVPPDTLVGGVPARFIRSLDED